MMPPLAPTKARAPGRDWVTATASAIPCIE
jgi:hypothetical protein